jgi:hypothetical protein
MEQRASPNRNRNGAPWTSVGVEGVTAAVDVHLMI